MIILEEVIKIHDASIKRFGGSYGIRDQSALASALIRPFQSFGGEELYPGTFEKAAAIMESLIANHPFVDGNKRIGFIVTWIFLEKFGYEIISDEEENFNFVISIASGKSRYEAIVDWLKKHTSKL